MVLKNNTALKVYKIRMMSVLATALLFLALSFCPLRNVLFGWLQPNMAMVKVPVYGKVIAHTQDKCDISFVDKLIPNNGKLSIKPTMSSTAWVSENDWHLKRFALFPYSYFKSVLVDSSHSCGAIYLRNCCLRI